MIQTRVIADQKEIHGVSGLGIGMRLCTLDLRRGIWIRCIRRGGRTHKRHELSFARGGLLLVDPVLGSEMPELLV